MNKKNFNVVGNNETENQELAKGIAFIKSRRAELNVVQMVENMEYREESDRESWYRVMQVIMAVHLRFQLFHYHQN